MSQRKQKPSVFALTRQSRCYGCDRKLLPDDIVQLKHNDEDREVFCLKCAELGHLEVIPSGNAQITRLATKYSTVCYVIMKWDETWKCYQRRGILVEPQSIDRAEAESGFKLPNRVR